MSFDRDFRALLQADLARALGLLSDAVYSGRQPQRITRTGLEVWVRPRASEPAGQVRVHVYDLHLRFKTRREQSQTGEGQLDQVRDTLSDLVKRYDGARPFSVTLPDLIAIEAREGTLDDDPDDDSLLDATLVLRVVER